MSECSSSVIIDRLLDFTIVALFATVGAILFLRSFINFFYISILVFLILFIILFLFTNKRLSKIILKIGFRFLIPKKLKEKAKISFMKFYNTLLQFNELIDVIIITIIVWFIIYTQAYFVARAFSVKIPYLYFITIFATVTIISLIPITISGLGTREAALLTLFSIYNIDPANIVGFSILLSVICLLVYAIFGIPLIFEHHK